MVFCVGLVVLMGYFVSVQVTQAHRHTAATATVAHVRAVLTPHVVALGTVRLSGLPPRLDERGPLSVPSIVCEQLFMHS